MPIVPVLLGAGIGYWVGGFNELNDAIIGAVVGLGVSVLIAITMFALISIGILSKRF